MAAQEHWKADLLKLLPGDVLNVRNIILVNLWQWSHNLLDDAQFQAIIDPLDTGLHISVFDGFSQHVSRFGDIHNFVGDLIGGIPGAVEMPDVIPPHPTSSLSSLTTSPGEQQFRRLPASDETTDTSGNDNVEEDVDTNAPASLV